MADRTFAPGEIIFREGAPSDAAYVIRSGHVGILKGEPETPVILAQLEPGDIFGEMGLVDERPRSATARADDEVQVTTVTPDEFVDMLFDRPKETIKYIRTLFERLRAMNAQFGAQAALILTSAIRPVRTKVTLQPLSPASAKVVDKGGLTLDRFPFRVGRVTLKGERDSLDANDLYLPDQPPFNVSRNHFSLERTQEQVVLRDRGSYLGTIVNGEHLGGDRTAGEAGLTEGENEVIVGGRSSPFRFQVVVEPRP